MDREEDSDVEVAGDEPGQTGGMAFVFPYTVNAGSQPITEVTVTCRGTDAAGTFEQTASRTYATAELRAGSLRVTLI